MGYLSADALHECYLRPQFAIAPAGTASPSRGLAVDDVAIGDWLEVPTPPPTPCDSRSGGEVKGWVLFCDCYPVGGGFAYRTRRGPTFLRVARPEDESLEKLRLYAADDDVLYVDDRRDVGAAVREVWNRTHVLPADAAAELTAARAECARAEARLRAALASARRPEVDPVALVDVVEFATDEDRFGLDR